MLLSERNGYRCLVRALVVVGLLYIWAGLLAPIASAEGGTWPPIGQLAGGLPHDVAIQGNYAYVAADAAMTVADISDCTSSAKMGQTGCCTLR
jgi:hypothetical protein